MELNRASLEVAVDHWDSRALVKQGRLWQLMVVVVLKPLPAVRQMAEARLIEVRLFLQSFAALYSDPLKALLAMRRHRTQLRQPAGFRQELRRRLRLALAVDCQLVLPLVALTGLFVNLVNTQGRR